MLNDHSQRIKAMPADRAGQITKRAEFQMQDAAMAGRFGVRAAAAMGEQRRHRQNIPSCGADGVAFVPLQQEGLARSLSPRGDLQRAILRRDLIQMQSQGEHRFQDFQRRLRMQHSCSRSWGRVAGCLDELLDGDE